MDKIPMTRGGFAALERELGDLKSKERPAIIRQIAEAREHGDLSENAEYHAAREKQGFIEGRIKELESILSRAEQIDTATAGGRLIFHLFGALAEFERAVIRERTSAGLQAARARGKQGGRPTRISASDLQMARTLLTNPAIRVADVAARIGVSPATLYRHLPGGRSGIADDP